MVDTAEDLLFECGICMDNKTIENINFLPCIHFLCSSCLNKLVKNECPYCRHTISEKEEDDSYDEAENEYNDVNFEIMVLEEDQGGRRRKNKRYRKQEKRILKLLENNSEVIVSVCNNNFTVLRNISTQ